MEEKLYIKEAIYKLIERKGLSFEEAKLCAHEIIGGKAPYELISAFLVALRMKGESPEEIAGFAKGMLEMAVKIELKNRRMLIDTCGTGGDGLNTFNASTSSAITLSAMGFFVAKHGNRAVSSQVGSADILEKIGLNINVEPNKIEDELEKKRFVFLFAPLFHPAMKNVAPVRRTLGIRTIFNILGPLTNPARPEVQLIGVFSEDYAMRVAETINILGEPKVALVVSGKADGKNIDEISPCGETLVIEVRNGKIKNKEYIRPEDIGMRRRVELLEIMRGEREADEFIAVLEGRKEAKEALIDFVSINAGAVLKIIGDVKDFREGYEKVKNFILSGKVGEHIRLLRKKD